MAQNHHGLTSRAATDEPAPPVHFSTPAEADAYRAGIADGMRRARGGEAPPAVPAFDPVPLRYRRDGWTPERQVAFIRAIAECGCVVEACRRVGMSAESAYELARRPDAQSFRIAWDIAMDNAVRRVGDGAFSRALNGVEIPHFYKGELVGTHRRYDERLTMFILRTRDRERFGRRLEAAEPLHSREGRALDLADMLAWLRRDAEKEARGLPRTVMPELGARYGEGEEDDEPVNRRDLGNVYAFAPGAQDDEDEADAQDAEAIEIERRCEAIGDEEADAHLARLEAEIRAMMRGDRDEDEACSPLDVSRTSSTSEPQAVEDKRRAHPEPDPRAAGESEAAP
ncbi:MAG TPA: hypothetical protein VF702_13860 [Allosphingosinicella sp.]|jgi:hypothetical protein